MDINVTGCDTLIVEQSLETIRALKPCPDPASSSLYDSFDYRSLTIGTLSNGDILFLLGPSCNLFRFAPIITILEDPASAHAANEACRQYCRIQALTRIDSVHLTEPKGWRLQAGLQGWTG